MKCQWIWNTSTENFQGSSGDFENCYGVTTSQIEADPQSWANHIDVHSQSDFNQSRRNPDWKFLEKWWEQSENEALQIHETLSFTSPYIHGTAEIVEGEESSQKRILDDLQNVRRSEAELELILQSSPIGIFAYNTDSVITNSNDYFVTMLGSSRDKVIGLNMLRDLKDEDLMVEVRKSLNGEPGFYEQTYKPVTGTRTLPVKAIFTPMRDHHDNVIGGVAVIEDITEKYFKDLEIEKLNALLSSVIQSTDDHIFSLDTDLRFLTFNDSFSTFMSRELGNKVEPGGEFLAPDENGFEDLPRFRSYLQETFEGQIHSKSYSVRLKDGKKHHFNTKFTPIYTDDKVTGVAVYARDLTDQLERQQLIEQHQALLKSITESLTEAVYRSSPDGTIIYTNRSCARLFGYEDPAEMLEINSNKMYADPQDRELFEKEIREKSRVENREIRFQRKDGSEFWALVNTNLEVDERGNEFYDGIIIDITDRKRIEDNIRRNEHLLKSITENISEGVFRSNDNDSLIFVNNALVEMLGYNTPSDLYTLPTTVGLYAHEHYPQKIGKLLREKGGFRNLEVEYRRKNGTTFWAYLSCTVTETESGRVYDGAVIDITQRKEDEHRLMISEETYKGIFNHSSDAIYVLDEEFRFIDVNHTSCQMYGYDKDYFIGRTPADLSVDEKNDLDSVMKDMRAAWTGKKVRFEFWAYRSDGTVFPKNVRVRRGVYFGHEVLLAFAEDITEQKENEQFQRRIIDDLMARNRDLEHFSHIISHNLRSPVANIMSLAEIFKLDNIDAETRLKVVDGMIQSAYNLDSTVRDLSEILSVRAGAHERKEEVDMSEIIRSAKTSLTKQIDSTFATLEVSLDSFTSVFGIKSYIQSIMYNLISNSIKYRHPDRMPVVEIKTEISADERSRQIIVSDNGLGMNLEKIGEKLFGLYQRFHNHTDGKGLGLYLVKYQVEAMNWNIRVESTPDFGTRFIIEIPNKEKS